MQGGSASNLSAHEVAIMLAREQVAWWIVRGVTRTEVARSLGGHAMTWRTWDDVERGLAWRWLRLPKFQGGGERVAA